MQMAWTSQGMTRVQRWSGRDNGEANGFSWLQRGMAGEQPLWLTAESPGSGKGGWPRCLAYSTAAGWGGAYPPDIPAGLLGTQTPWWEWMASAVAAAQIQQDEWKASHFLPFGCSLRAPHPRLSVRRYAAGPLKTMRAEQGLLYRMRA